MPHENLSSSNHQARPKHVLKWLLKDGAKKAWNQNSEQLTKTHQFAHVENRSLAFWFEEIYSNHISNFKKSQQPTLELGSGGSRFREYHPSLLTSDILKIEGLDLVIDAQQIGFPNEGLGNITFVNVLHHLPKPLEFMKEAERTLVSGGRLVFTEPYISPFSYFFYKGLHHEPCQIGASIHHPFPEGDPLKNSNQALPTILICKNWPMVAEVAPNLRLKSVTYHSSLSYFLTGGVNYKSFLPLKFWIALNRIDRFFCHFFGKYFASFMTIVIEKI